MSYLIFNTKNEAVSRTREAWVQRLGRPKRAEDITEFLWDIAVGKDGRTAVEVKENFELLTASEGLSKTETLDGNWSK
jgi:hypothetical protein